MDDSDADSDTDLVELVMRAGVECAECSDSVLVTHEAVRIEIGKYQVITYPGHVALEYVPAGLPVKGMHLECWSDEVAADLCMLAQTNPAPSVPNEPCYVASCSYCGGDIGVDEWVVRVDYGEYTHAGQLVTTSHPEEGCISCLRLLNEYTRPLWLVSDLDPQFDIAHGSNDDPVEFSYAGEGFQDTRRRLWRLGGPVIYDQEPDAPDEEDEEDEEDARPCVQAAQ